MCPTGESPDVDGNVFVDEGFEHLAPGDRISVRIDESAEYDLWGTPTA